MAFKLGLEGEKRGVGDNRVERRGLGEKEGARGGGRGPGGGVPGGDVT